MCYLPALETSSNVEAPPKPARPGGLTSASSTGNLLSGIGLSLPKAPPPPAPAYSSLPSSQQPMTTTAMLGGAQPIVGGANGGGDAPLLGYIVASTPEQVAELMKGPSPLSTPRRQPLKPPMPGTSQVCYCLKLLFVD